VVSAATTSSSAVVAPTSIDGPGNDIVRGGPGNDTLVGAPGADQLEGGGGGADSLRYIDYTQRVIVTLDDMANDGVRDEGDNVMSDIETVIGTERSDILIGNDGPNRLEGDYGNDVIRGGGGDDVLLGGVDADEVYGEGGDDVLDGGTYNDLLVGVEGADSMDGRATSGSSTNVCDSDPADVKVTRCTKDGDVPSALYATAHDGSHPNFVTVGSTLTYSVHFSDTAGVRRVEARFTAPDSTIVASCPSVMTSMYNEPGIEDSQWTWTCTIPSDLPPGEHQLEARATDRIGLAGEFGSAETRPTVVSVTVSTESSPQ